MAGRGGHLPIALVLHTAVGSLAGTDATFLNPASQVSAHVCVALDGRIHEYVDPQDTAWANGRLETGNSWPGPAGINPNAVSLSAETEDAGQPQTEPVTEAQYNAVLAWGRAMLEFYPSVKYLVAHRAISSQTRSCPGARWLATGKFTKLATDLGLNAVP